MAGITTAALIGLGGSALATGAGFLQSQQQQGIQRQGLDAASANAAMQMELQRAMMERQYKLSTAGQVDARGNQVIYNPTTNTWESILSPKGQELLARSDAITRMHDVETLGRGADERSQAFQRRQAEGSAAAPLLDAIRYGYGAPTKEGVVGANKVAGVTGATEGADAARSGYTGAALRTGFGYAPLEQTLASVDRGATGGVRSALANADATGNTAYNEALTGFQGPRANLYNALATRASNTENIPFTPSNIPETLDTVGTNRAVRAPAYTMNPYAGSATNTASKQLIDAIGGQTTTPYGQGITSFTNALSEYFKNKKATDSGGGWSFGGSLSTPANA